jgi:hypothetical protein
VLIVTDYIGKDKGKIAQIEEQIKRRNHYENMLSALMKEQKIKKKLIKKNYQYIINAKRSI